MIAFLLFIAYGFAALISGLLVASLSTFCAAFTCFALVVLLVWAKLEAGQHSFNARIYSHLLWPCVMATLTTAITVADNNILVLFFGTTITAFTVFSSAGKCAQLVQEL